MINNLTWQDRPGPTGGGLGIDVPRRFPGIILSENDMEQVLRRAVESASFDFSGAHLYSEGAFYLAGAIMANNLFSFQHFNIGYCKMSLEGFESLLEVAVECKQLENFVVRENSLPKEAGLAISKLLGARGHLKELDLRDNRLGDIGVASIGGAFTTDMSDLRMSTSISLLTLTVLDLSGNDLSDMAVLALCRGLMELSDHTRVIERTPALKILRLHRNRIGDKGALCLAQLLNNAAVKSHSPNHNNIGGRVNNTSPRDYTPVQSAYNSMATLSLTAGRNSSPSPNPMIYPQVNKTPSRLSTASTSHAGVNLNLEEIGLNDNLIGHRGVMGLLGFSMTGRVASLENITSVPASVSSNDSVGSGDHSIGSTASANSVVHRVASSLRTISIGRCRLTLDTLDVVTVNLSASTSTLEVIEMQFTEQSAYDAIRDAEQRNYHSAMNTRTTRPGSADLVPSTPSRTVLPRFDSNNSSGNILISPGTLVTQQQQQLPEPGYGRLSTTMQKLAAAVMSNRYITSLHLGALPEVIRLSCVRAFERSNMALYYDTFGALEAMEMIQSVLGLSTDILTWMDTNLLMRKTAKPKPNTGNSPSQTTCVNVPSTPTTRGRDTNDGSRSVMPTPSQDPPRLLLPRKNPGGVLALSSPIAQSAAARAVASSSLAHASTQLQSTRAAAEAGAGAGTGAEVVGRTTADSSPNTVSGRGSPFLPLAELATIDPHSPLLSRRSTTTSYSPQERVSPIAQARVVAGDGRFGVQLPLLQGDDGEGSFPAERQIPPHHHMNNDDDDHDSSSSSTISGSGLHVSSILDISVGSSSSAAVATVAGAGINGGDGGSSGSGGGVLGDTNWMARWLEDEHRRQQRVIDSRNKSSSPVVRNQQYNNSDATTNPGAAPERSGSRDGDDEKIRDVDSSSLVYSFSRDQDLGQYQYQYYPTGSSSSPSSPLPATAAAAPSVAAVATPADDSSSIASGESTITSTSFQRLSRSAMKEYSRRNRGGASESSVARSHSPGTHQGYSAIPATTPGMIVGAGGVRWAADEASTALLPLAVTFFDGQQQQQSKKSLFSVLANEIERMLKPPTTTDTGTVFPLDINNNHAYGAAPGGAGTTGINILAFEDDINGIHSDQTVPLFPPREAVSMVPIVPLPGMPYGTVISSATVIDRHSSSPPPTTTTTGTTRGTAETLRQLDPTLTTQTNTPTTTPISHQRPHNHHSSSCSGSPTYDSIPTPQSLQGGLTPGPFSPEPSFLSPSSSSSHSYSAKDVLNAFPNSVSSALTASQWKQLMEYEQYPSPGLLDTPYARGTAVALALLSDTSPPQEPAAAGRKEDSSQARSTPTAAGHSSSSVAAAGGGVGGGGLDVTPHTFMSSAALTGVNRQINSGNGLLPGKVSVSCMPGEGRASGSGNRDQAGGGGGPDRGSREKVELAALESFLIGRLAEGGRNAGVGGAIEKGVPPGVQERSAIRALHPGVLEEAIPSSSSSSGGGGQTVAASHPPPLSSSADVVPAATHAGTHAAMKSGIDTELPTHVVVTNGTEVVPPLSRAPPAAATATVVPAAAAAATSLTSSPPPPPPLVLETEHSEVDVAATTATTTTITSSPEELLANYQSDKLSFSELLDKVVGEMTTSVAGLAQKYHHPDLSTDGGAPLNNTNSESTNKQLPSSAAATAVLLAENAYVVPMSPYPEGSVDTAAKPEEDLDQEVVPVAVAAAVTVLPQTTTTINPRTKPGNNTDTSASTSTSAALLAMMEDRLDRLETVLLTVLQVGSYSSPPPYPDPDQEPDHQDQDQEHGPVIRPTRTQSFSPVSSIRSNAGTMTRSRSPSFGSSSAGGGGGGGGGGWSPASVSGFRRPVLTAGGGAEEGGGGGSFQLQVDTDANNELPQPASFSESVPSLSASSSIFKPKPTHGSIAGITGATSGSEQAETDHTAPSSSSHFSPESLLSHLWSLRSGSHNVGGDGKGNSSGSTGRPMSSMTPNTTHAPSSSFINAAFKKEFSPQAILKTLQAPLSSPPPPTATGSGSGSGSAVLESEAAFVSQLSDRIAALESAIEFEHESSIQVLDTLLNQHYKLSQQQKEHLQLLRHQQADYNNDYRHHDGSPGETIGGEGEPNAGPSTGPSTGHSTGRSTGRSSSRDPPPGSSSSARYVSPPPRTANVTTGSGHRATDWEYDVPEPVSEYKESSVGHSGGVRARSGGSSSIRNTSRLPGSSGGGNGNGRGSNSAHRHQQQYQYQEYTTYPPDARYSEEEAAAQYDTSSPEDQDQWGYHSGRGRGSGPPGPVAVQQPPGEYYDDAGDNYPHDYGHGATSGSHFNGIRVQEDIEYADDDHDHDHDYAYDGVVEELYHSAPDDDGFLNEEDDDDDEEEEDESTAAVAASAEAEQSRREVEADQYRKEKRRRSDPNFFMREFTGIPYFTASANTPASSSSSAAAAAARTVLSAYRSATRYDSSNGMQKKATTPAPPALPSASAAAAASAKNLRSTTSSTTQIHTGSTSRSSPSYKNKPPPPIVTDLTHRAGSGSGSARSIGIGRPQR